MTFDKRVPSGVVSVDLRHRSDILSQYSVELWNCARSYQSKRHRNAVPFAFEKDRAKRTSSSSRCCLCLHHSCC